MSIYVSSFYDAVHGRKVFQFATKSGNGIGPVLDSIGQKAKNLGFLRDTRYTVMALGAHTGVLAEGRSIPVASSKPKIVRKPRTKPKQ